MRTTYTYEPNRNLKTQVLHESEALSGSPTILSQYDYLYDSIARRTSVQNSGLAFVEVTDAFNLFGYNSYSELTSSDRYLGSDITNLNSPVSQEHRGYQYDDIGNREQVDSADAVAAFSINYGVNELNQYTTVNPHPDRGEGSKTLLYDADGNLRDDGMWEYTWNAENRLIEQKRKIPDEGSEKVEHIYDYQGRRSVKKVSNYILANAAYTLDRTEYFIYDGWNMIQHTTYANGQLQDQEVYTWGVDLSGTLQGAGGVGGLLSRSENSSGVVETHYYTCDGNGNVGQLIDMGTSGISAHYQYDPFGNTTHLKDFDTTGVVHDNPYRFSTKFTDDETDLVYYGYRFYNTNLGRWGSRDPVGERGGANVYNFVKNTPINSFDYLGLKIDIIDIIIPIVEPILDNSCDIFSEGQEITAEVEASCVRKCVPVDGPQKNCASCSDSSGKGIGQAVYICEKLSWPWGAKFVFDRWANGPPHCDAAFCNASGSSGGFYCQQDGVVWDPPGIY